MGSKYIFDTNIFDEILDGDIDISLFPKRNEYFVTHIQKDEIEVISKPEKQERKKKLIDIFKDFNANKLPTESFVLGKSRLGSAKLGNGTILEKLRIGNLKHTEDALIGEVAIKNNLILVTNDPQFLKKVKSAGGKAISFKEFMMEI